jgi:hypothetical protein
MFYTEQVRPYYIEWGKTEANGGRHPLNRVASH